MAESMSQTAPRENALEQRFDVQLSSQDQLDWLKRMSSEPNQVGSPHDKANADWTLVKFRKYGWHAHIETYQVLYPTPISEAVEMLGPKPFKATLQETPIPGDTSSTAKDYALPAYLAYQGDGDVTAPLVYVAMSFALSLSSRAFLPNILTTSDTAALLLMGLAYGLLGGGFCEELGWTGFAVPQLRLRRGVLTTGLIVGALWGAWHFPLFWERDSFSGALPLALLLVRLFSWLPAYRVLMVWAYDRTGSLLVAMLMHASLTACTLILSTSATGVAFLTYGLVVAVAQ